jgi:hypothetical protein
VFALVLKGETGRLCVTFALNFKRGDQNDLM